MLLAFISVKFDFIKSLEPQDRKNWELLFLPLTYLILIVLFSDGYKWVVFISLTAFALADLFAALIGTSNPKKQFRITTDQKSISSLVTFGIVSFIMLIMVSYVYGKFVGFNGTLNFSLDIYFIAAAVTVSLITTLFEAMSSRGFNIPVIVVLLFLRRRFRPV